MTRTAFSKLNPWGVLAAGAIHAAVPVTSALWFGAPSGWVLSNLLFVAFLVLLLAAAPGRTAHWLGSLLSGAWMLLSLALGASYYMQGSGFNDAFFYHLDIGSLEAAANSYGTPSAFSALLLVLALLAPWILLSGKRPGAAAGNTAAILSGSAAALLLSVALSAPAQSWLEYRAARTPAESASPPTISVERGRPERPSPGAAPVATPAQSPEASFAAGPGTIETRPPAVTPDKEKDEAQRIAEKPEATTASARKPKNIVLIYAEGLEQTYLDSGLFGDVMPNIRDLASEGRHYVNMHQLPGTTWTVAGMVASQCGFPVVVGHHSAGNSTMATVREPFPDSECFADILREKGYRTVFMGGADHDFAGKGAFLRSHGYDEILGLDELRPLVEDQTYLKDWGIYDDTLFALATDKLRELQAAEQPWLLTLLTVDTHHPRGDPSRSCEPFAGNDDPMSDAIYCTDQLIGAFVREALSIVDLERTVIAVFSDHLSMRNSLWNTLRNEQERRRLLFLVIDDGTPGQFALSGSHFDVAPTLLDLAQVPVDRPLGHGVSLLEPSVQNRRGKPRYDNYWDVPRVFASEQTALEAGVRVSAADWSMNIGDLRLDPNRHGFDFEYGMFMAVLNEKGKVQDAIYYDDYPRLLENYGGQFVVGVSMRKGDPGPLVFAGRVSDDPSKILMRPLTGDIEIAPIEIMQLMQR